MQLPVLHTDDDLETKEVTISLAIPESMDRQIRELKTAYGARAVNQWLRKVWRAALESQRHEER